MRIDSVLSIQLDTAAGNTYLPFDMQFWLPSWVIRPDSCYRRINAPCNFSSHYDSTEYHEWLGWWRDWNQKLFASYRIYLIGDTIYRLNGSGSGDQPGTSNLYATKSTLLALSHECSVMYLSLPYSVWVGTKPVHPVLRRVHQDARFNALGRKMDPWNENPGSLGIPWRPGLTPTFKR